MNEMIVSSTGDSPLHPLQRALDEQRGKVPCLRQSPATTAHLFKAHMELLDEENHQDSDSGSDITNGTYFTNATYLTNRTCITASYY
ncbi:MAG: hypothetical protein V3V61_00875 [Gammaproteobacteria bacterium]